MSFNPDYNLSTIYRCFSDFPKDVIDDIFNQCGQNVKDTFNHLNEMVNSSELEKVSSANAEEKINIIHNTFPNLSRNAIMDALNRHQWSINETIDEIISVNNPDHQRVDIYPIDPINPQSNLMHPYHYDSQYNNSNVHDPLNNPTSILTSIFNLLDTNDIYSIVENTRNVKEAMDACFSQTKEINFNSNHLNGDDIKILEKCNTFADYFKNYFIKDLFKENTFELQLNIIVDTMPYIGEDECRMIFSQNMSLYERLKKIEDISKTTFKHIIHAEFPNLDNDIIDDPVEHYYPYKEKVVEYLNPIFNNFPTFQLLKENLNQERYEYNNMSQDYQSFLKDLQSIYNLRSSKVENEGEEWLTKSQVIMDREDKEIEEKKRLLKVRLKQKEIVVKEMERDLENFLSRHLPELKTKPVRKNYIQIIVQKLKDLNLKLTGKKFGINHSELFEKSFVLVSYEEFANKDFRLSEIEQEIFPVYLQRIGLTERNTLRNIGIKEFFVNGTNLSREVLSKIWTIVADDENMELTIVQFYRFLRLVSYVQIYGDTDLNYSKSDCYHGLPEIKY